MLEIKNLLFQPLTLHLKDSNKSIHLVSRGKVAIQEKDLSQEIKRAQSKGRITIKAANSGESQSQEPSSVHKQTTTSKKRRNS